MQLCGALCKMNSKDGRKKEECKIIYTLAQNVLKSKSNVPGQVQYRDGKLNAYFQVEKEEANNATSKRLHKITEDLGNMNAEALEKLKQQWNQTLNTEVKLQHAEAEKQKKLEALQREQQLKQQQ